MDWVVWHTDYESGSPLRAISMCAGEARDLRGALERVQRRDLVGRLVELDPSLAAAARGGLAALGADGLEVISADAGELGAYRGAAPADLVLECGVFGNISDEDVERTVRLSPALCAPGATLIWTRHRREPDLTPSVRRWFSESGFEEVAFEPVPDSKGSVGVVRFVGSTVPLTDHRLFTFTRTADDPPPS